MIYVIDLCMLSIHADTKWHLEMLYGNTMKIITLDDINMQPPTRWVYEWEDPHFYNMLLQQWQTTATWTGQTWQDYKAELLRVQGLNVMSTAEY
jgi:hypothetical protein